MSQDVKAYPKPTKDIFCLDCKKIILSREELFVVYKDSSFFPIHVNCYQKLLDMELIKVNPSNIPIGKLMTGLQKMILKVALAIGILAIIFVYWFMFHWMLITEASIWFIGLMTIILLIVPIVIIYSNTPQVFHGMNHSWKHFEKHLPATCRKCQQAIPPQHRNCLTCGWKYMQTETRLKHKAAK